MNQVKRNAQALANALLRRKCRLVAGGTDNHLLLWDLTGLGITEECQKICCRLSEVIHGSHALIPTWTCKLRTSNSSDGCTRRNHHSQPSSPSVFQKKPNGCEGPRRCCAALPSSQRRHQLRALIRLTADLWDTVCTEVLTDLDFPDPDVNAILKSRFLPFSTSHSSSSVELKSLIDGKS
ncbi:hypothetical protein ACFX15_027446 [Malus domestica]